MKWELSKEETMETTDRNSLPKVDKTSSQSDWVMVGKALNWFRYNLALIIPLIVVLVVFSSLHPGFLTIRNMTNILREIAVIAILAVGLTVVMATGKFDLSFYGSSNFVMMTCAVLAFTFKLPFLPMILVGIGLGMGIGAISGFLVSILFLPDLMATLGVAGLFGGLAYKYTQGVQLWMYSFPRVLWLGTGKVIGPITVPVVILIIVVIVAYIFLNKLKYGLRMEAVGSNPDAATHSGISIVRYRFLAYVLAGIFYGLAALVYLGRLGKGQCDIFDFLILPVIVAAFMGTSMFKGKANIIGVVIGAFVYGCVLNGLTLLNIHWTRADLYRPIILLIVLIVAITIRKKRIVG